MRHTWMVGLAGAVVWALLAQPADAQSRGIDVRGYWGYSQGLDDTVYEATLGAVAITDSLNARWRFGVEVWHANMFGDRSQRQGKVRATVYAVHWEYEFAPTRLVRPYLVFGVGLIQYRRPGAGGWGNSKAVPLVNGGLGRTPTRDRALVRGGGSTRRPGAAATTDGRGRLYVLRAVRRRNGGYHRRAPQHSPASRPRRSVYRFSGVSQAARVCAIECSIRPLGS